MVRIDSLDHEGRGVARVERKVVFVDGALPGEAVELQIWRHKPTYDLANTTRILSASPCALHRRAGTSSVAAAAACSTSSRVLRLP